MSKNTVSYVTEAAGDLIEVKSVDNGVIDFLRSLGFTKIPDDSYKLEVSSKINKAKILGALRDRGVSFSDGHGWCPSAVFEYLREQGLLSGEYNKISWIGSGKYRIERS